MVGPHLVPANQTPARSLVVARKASDGGDATPTRLLAAAVVKVAPKLPTAHQQMGTSRRPEPPTRDRRFATT